MKIPFTFTKMYNVGSKLECFFPPFVESNYLLCKHSLASNFINICLPVQIVQGALPRKSWEWTGSMCGCQAPPLHRWSRYALLALWASKAKVLRSTLTYHFSTFLNTHGGGHRWLYFRVKFSSLWIEINVATALYENQRKLKILVWLSFTAMHVNVKGVGEPIVYSDAKLWFWCALVCVTLDEKSLGGTPRLSEWLGGGNVWRLQGCSHSPAPHVTSRPIPRTQSTRLAFSSEFNVHPLFVVAVTVIHDFFAYNIMQHFACFVNTPCFWKVDRANNFNLRMVKQYTQSLNGPDWWTTSSSLASLLPLGLPYHGSTFEHGQFVATTCPHKMSSIIPQQNLHTLKHERH